MKRPLPNIDHGLRPWLLLSAACTTLQHIPHQPIWMSGLLLSLLIWSLWLWHYRGTPPQRWQLVCLVGIACAATLFEHRTLLGRDAGVALLILFMALKLLETRSARDVHVVVSLGCFLLLTHYFYAQDIFTGLWLLASLLILTATLIRLQAGAFGTTNDHLRPAGRMLLQALPFMLLLFLLFPRVSGPLWGLPSDAHSGQSGLSDQMSPGSISELVQSGEIAFRVRFDSGIPDRSQLYWRGPVLERYDGQTWRPERRRHVPAEIEYNGSPVRYESTLEPHQQRWLLALDAPVLPAQPLFSLNGTLTAERKEPLTQRTRIQLQSALNYRFNVEESADTLTLNLQLPPGRNPQARALAQAWKATSEHPDQIIAKALARFGSNDYAYTLRPPLLGAQPIDEFLFNTRRGFCEHYAAAFVFLMRAAGIPARVVTGYQGGELNPVDNYLTIRQSDAHAWAEVWLTERGWVRIDPTSVVAPARVDEGLANALPAGEPIPALLQIRTSWLRLLRHRWEALNNAWNQYVLGYNNQRQRDFLSRLGLPDTDWQTLAMALGGSCGLALALLMAWSLRQRTPVDPVSQLWQRTIAWLQRKQVHCAPAETPNMLLARIERDHADLAPMLAEVVEAYLRTRYGDEPEQLDRLRRAVKALS